ncbi:hypothetical protein AX14_004218 [Amanita brunnescens Koide BX004]|nr:hypothetical protein AX14_004218 [Amanita brunnescens Koide BX004]
MAPAVMNKIDLSRVNSGQEHSTPKLSNKASTFPRSVALPPSTQVPDQKKVNRRSNKLIINWLQRKLGGTVKKPDNASFRPKTSNGLGTHSRTESVGTRRKTVSLDGDEENDRTPEEEDDVSCRPSFVTRDSTWSPASVLEADDDASVRPLPPSIPPSPSPSRSSSSYLSRPRTFKSMAASTKPTTLLSIDLGSNHMAHIAQAPITPSPHVGRMSSQAHARQSSLTSNSITFSALSVAGISRPSSTITNGNVGSSTQQNAYGQLLSVQAPLHTAHHPRNNPRPSSPPLDNASVLTLASSAFGIPGRLGIAGYSSAAPSAIGGGDSISQFDGSMTFPDVENTSIVIGEDDRLDERDVDASVRALRPRSSRRGSWESEASGWSARIQQTPGTPSLTREKSVWTANSVKTGAFSADNLEVEQEAPDDVENDGVRSIDDTRVEDLQESRDMSLHPSEMEVVPTSGLPDDDTPADVPARTGSIDTHVQESDGS